MAYVKKQNKSGKRGRILPLSKEEQAFIRNYCDENLLKDTNEVAAEIASILDRDHNTIRTHMWRQGYRPRQEIIGRNLVNRIHKQFLKDEGLEFLYADPPKLSDEVLIILEKFKK